MDDKQRIEQLVEDAAQVLTIANQLLQTIATHSRLAIQDRDERIADLNNKLESVEQELANASVLIDNANMANQQQFA